MGDEQPIEYRGRAYLIFMVALVLSVLCGLGVAYRNPLLGETMNAFVQQFSLLIGVNAAFVTLAAYFVILVGKVKRNR